MKSLRIILLIFLSFSFSLAQENARQTITPENAHLLSELMTWQGAEEGVNLPAFNLTNFEMVIINGDFGVESPIVFINLSTSAITRKLPVGTTFAFSNDRELFASINSDGIISVYETANFNLINTFTINIEYEPVLNMLISPNHQYLAIGLGSAERVTEAEFTFILLNLDTGEEVFQLERESEDIVDLYATGLVFSDDSDNLFVSTSDGFVEQWEIVTQEHHVIGEDATYSSSRILVKLYDDRLAYLTEEGFSIIDTDTHTEDFSISISDNPAILVAAIAAHPSQPLLAVSYIDLDTRETFLQIWNTETIELVFENIVGESGFLHVLDIAFNPDGTLLATSGEYGLLRIWGILADE